MVGNDGAVAGIRLFLALGSRLVSAECEVHRTCQCQKQGSCHVKKEAVLLGKTVISEAPTAAGKAGLVDEESLSMPEERLLGHQESQAEAT
jgi:hypothetical protein